MTEDKGKSSVVKGGSQSLPLEVPDCMRTKRSTPRVIAGVVTLVWLFIFVLGVQALSRQNSEPNSALDQFLTVGTKYWIADDPDKDGLCTAHFSSQFKTYKEDSKDIEKSKQAREPNLEVSGSFIVGFFGEPTVSTLRVSSQFNKFLQLSSFTSQIAIGKRAVLIQNIDDEPELALMTIDTGQKTLSRRVPRPTPIYLIRKTDEAYSIQFPENTIDLASFLPASSGTNKQLLQSVDRESFKACQDHLAKLQSKEGPTNKDFKKYMEQFTIISQGVGSALKTEEDSNDKAR